MSHQTPENIRPRLSIIATCYNEEDCVEEFHRRISIAADGVVGQDYELILLNDGSRDRTWDLMRGLVARDPRLVLVNLSRRHGHQIALTAGLGLCRGDKILTIDSDLQDPPESLADMWRLIHEQQADVVYGQRRTRRGESLYKKGTAAIFYWLLRKIGGGEIPSNSGDFRLISRRVLDILNAMPEQHRFIRGMVSWIGLRQIPLHYDRDPRYSGTSNYTFVRMLTLAIDALTAFSVVPLRIASYLGLLMATLSMVMLAYTLERWAVGRVVDGWTSLTTIVLILGSIQLVLFGVLGEYVGRLYLEAKRRPLYVIDQIVTADMPAIELLQNPGGSAVTSPSPDS